MPKINSWPYDYPTLKGFSKSILDALSNVIRDQKWQGAFGRGTFAKNQGENIDRKPADYLCLCSLDCTNIFAGSDLNTGQQKRKKKLKNRIS